MPDERIIFTPEPGPEGSRPAAGVESRPEVSRPEKEGNAPEAGTDQDRLKQALQKLGGDAPAAGEVADDARNAALLANADAQVERLLGLAATKGVPHAITVAQRLKEAYVLDQLHDELLKKFHEGLQERGLR